MSAIINKVEEAKALQTEGLYDRETLKKVLALLKSEHFQGNSESPGSMPAFIAKVKAARLSLIHI